MDLGCLSESLAAAGYDDPRKQPFSSVTRLPAFFPISLPLVRGRSSGLETGWLSLVSRSGYVCLRKRRMKYWTGKNSKGYMLCHGGKMGRPETGTSQLHCTHTQGGESPL